ncbi:MAG: hypothetical protein AW08_03332 [Candidatus Accumulibacter adjunctus]|uniref:Uncharacterized protein n=1 Tax=Candidatus Accumulibacter adjunctus TaxID=1454001 RepID=A0A011PG87_9PROT|nr:MAG: hypothetical protein AW08_03332 [Candidatus Accumulibacter adjunctus]
MQALLSFDQAPPIAAPFRFFLTAPIFALLAGLLMLASGPQLFASRWTPAALALTHLITVGFMLQVMLGALLQILPVVAGANIAHPLRVATWVHALLVPGTLLLAAGLLTSDPLALRLAAVALALGVALFLVAAGHALAGVPAGNPTILGLKLALLGLGISSGLGVVLALALDGSSELPVLQLTGIHLTWGLVGWSTTLLAAVALVVVPMFQLTPAYPQWFARRFFWSLLIVLACWSIASVAGWHWPATLLATGMLALLAVFAALTLHLQRQSKRARLDATQRYWRLAMLSALSACALALVSVLLPETAASRPLPLLWGVLVLHGSLISVINGMLYKIVPFLVWLHLQNAGGGRILAPNMQKVIDKRQIDHQLHAHLVALALLSAAAVQPEWFTYPAASALLLASGWLLRNLLAATAFYRQHRERIASQARATPVHRPG